MKKGKNGKNKDIYEDNPWDDDPPGRLVPVENFLPPPHIMKKAKRVRIIKASKELPLPLYEDDAEDLRKRARQAGLTPRGLIAALVHDYLHGRDA